MIFGESSLYASGLGFFKLLNLKWQVLNKYPGHLISQPDPFSEWSFSLWSKDKTTPVMKKFFKWTGIILLGLIAGLFITIELRQDLKYDAPYPDIKASKDSAVIARGKALVFGPAHCANCHTPVELHYRVNAGEEVPLIGGNVFSLPIATIVTPNLTPDKDGIGRLTD